MIVSPMLILQYIIEFNHLFFENLTRTVILFHAMHDQPGLVNKFKKVLYLEFFITSIQSFFLYVTSEVALS